MVKLIFCLHRRPELSREQFQAYWRDRHAPLVASFGWTSTCPPNLVAYLARIDDFIEAEIKPAAGAGRQRAFLRPPPRMGPHRLRQRRPAAPRMGGAAGRGQSGRQGRPFYRFSLPKEYGGKDGSNLWMAVIREHLAAKGLGLFNDLQNEHSVVGNFPIVLMLRDFGTPAQKRQIHPRLAGRQVPRSPSA
jgi:acyl-CoA dehydrogenase